MESNLAQRLKKESLETKIAEFEEDYKGLERDLRGASDSDEKNRLESKLNRKLEEIEKTEEELKQLNNSTINKVIDILNKCFTTHTDNILRAYNLSLPNRLTNKEKNPQNALELINGLQLPQQYDTYSYIDKFVGYLLLLEQPLPLEVKERLKEWAEININNCQQLIQHLRSELDKKQQYSPGLLVTISERSEQKGGYVIEAWLVKNIIQDNQKYSASDFEQLCINQQAVIPTDETLGNVPELLKVMIAQSLKNCQQSLKEIHIFLPHQLMNHAVDGWKNWQEYEEDDEYSTTIGDDYEVLLRCSERLKGNDPSIIKWREKANILKDELARPAEQSFILASSDNTKSLFKQLRDEKVLAVKITTVFQQKEPGMLLWKAAVPLALWVRQQLPQIINQSVLDNILKGCTLKEVPSKVKSERFSAFDCDFPESHIGRHLCLLWDDPNLVPPEQRVTQNYL